MEARTQARHASLPIEQSTASSAQYDQVRRALVIENVLST
jgi:hypothetical protein